LVVPASGELPQAARFTAAVLEWFAQHGRTHLPWQHNLTPYRVWVSEIMLQQTQVATVIPYYERFMTRFPQVQTLAAAPIDEVLHLWTGLGYYARGRNLHRAAQQIVNAHAGVFPATLAELQLLPGIGRSTAGAILSISMAQRQPILDGNVKRVLARYFGIAGYPGVTAVARRLWELADACTPAQQTGAYTQAIMDLGATLCVRSRPLCSKCPVASGCVARRMGRQQELPTRKPRRERPLREAFAVVLVRDHQVLLEKRPPTGLWGGLWTFPQFDERRLASQWIVERYGAVAPALDQTYVHAFSHFDLHLQPLVLRVDARVRGVQDDDRHLWYDPQRPVKIGLTKPVVDLLQRLLPTISTSQQASLWEVPGQAD
jgi:A/G-specific adenine glycosylase